MWVSKDAAETAGFTTIFDQSSVWMILDSSMLEPRSMRTVGTMGTPRRGSWRR